MQNKETESIKNISRIETGDFSRSTLRISGTLLCTICRCTDASRGWRPI